MAVVVLWTIVMVAVAFASGCYGHTCDGEVTVFGRNPGEGRLSSTDTWESGAIDGLWLDFPKQRAWIFDLHELGGRTPVTVIPYVSAQADPVHEFGNFTIAAGNLAEISGVAPDQVVIHNGTCADYFLRLVVEAPPRATNASLPSEIPDAGGDAEAGP
jgi:hypothetical protein